LKDVLRESKNMTNKEIATRLDVPITKVEHWFRNDSCFAIPDENIWLKLKELLNIQTSEFDESILTFEEREGVFEKSNRFYFDNGISPTITSASANEKIITSAAMRGRYNADGDTQQQIEVSDREYANAITTVQKDSMVANGLRIRRLTPKECWRLMGFDDEDYEKAAQVNSNTQLYKQAGNSIVVNVLEAIFKNLCEGVNK
jgi:DNA (cytosine-5)-methyltransferase 1